jgi:NhaP-type Na+/H+ or K+/H+ antiporter
VGNAVSLVIGLAAAWMFLSVASALALGRALSVLDRVPVSRP